MTEVTMLDKERVKQINTELEKAGVFHSSLHPFTSRYLPRALHNDEHIMAAVFGRRKESEGFFGFVEGLLVATDRRIIFLDHRPGYTTMDEITYDVVSGVNCSTTLLYASMTLFTRVANYHLSFASHMSVQKFADYIETRVLEHAPAALQQAETPREYEMLINDSGLKFLTDHDTAVLSTIERTGAVNGAVVYYTMLNNYPYFMTKEHTHKANVMLGNQHVSFVVYDEQQLQTIQIQGIVEQIHDQTIKTQVRTTMMHPRTYQDGSHKPPILRTGSDRIQIYKVTPTRFNFTDYSNL